ncbi:MAG: hypothetical protein IPP48_13000 [Chitinophagaceae bacterium]|nr:hypothetical protein [Chitinophagaceae bacterium]
MLTTETQFKNSLFYEYAGNKLVKIYKKNSKHTDPVDVYDPVYEQQLGPIAYGNVNDIDSIAYNSRGMISEIYKWYLNFSLGVVTRMPYVNHYTKFTYMPSNDSLISKIEVMPFVNAPITDPNYNVVNLAEYDLSIKNPLYTSIYNFSFPFYYIDMLPVNTSTGYVDIYMSLSPYLLKQFSAKSLGAYGPQVITYTTTNQKDIANRLITCSSGFSTWGTAGGFSFVF